MFGRNRVSLKYTYLELLIKSQRGSATSPQHVKFLIRNFAITIHHPSSQMTDYASNSILRALPSFPANLSRDCLPESPIVHYSRKYQTILEQSPRSPPRNCC